MNPLDLHSESYSATGNLASEGVLNQLGRPSMDRLTVLVREAVQNGWDAKLPNAPSVRFGIAGWTLSLEQRNLLKTLIFPQTPPRLGLRETLDSAQDFNVLALYDRGTSGLGGPTRADVFDDSHESRDFVDFLRNVGQPPDKQLGGGTFGYGKAALYLSSAVRTIVVHTRCSYKGKPETRLIAAALGPQYKGEGTDNRLYTGRHWWGRYLNNVAEPITGAEADMLATRLGLPGFGQGERGTTILLLQPIFDDRSPFQAMNYIATVLLLNFWPKMIVGSTGLPSMKFELSWQGQPIPLPDPQNFPPLQGFVEAMQNLKKYGSNFDNDAFSQVVDIASKNPKKHLGLLSLQKFPVVPRKNLDTGGPEGGFAFQNLCHHIALMRPAELVVKYIPGPALPTDKMEYAAVFIADEAVDRVFAKAEPPTHDDWVAQFLEQPNDRTFVRVALRRISEKVEEFVAPPATTTRPAQVAPLGAFAGLLGGLLPGEEGPGLTTNPDSDGSRPGSSSGGGKSKVKLQHPRLSIKGGGQLDIVDNLPAMIVSFEIEPVPDTQGTLVRARPGAILDNGDLENEPPVGGRTPSVIGWLSPEGKRYPASPDILIPHSQKGLWRVAITVPDNIMVGLDLSATEVLG